MNTNDPKAPYTVKLNGPIEAATAPLLSDKEMDNMFCRHMGASPGETSNDALEEVRAFYEAKIASGELMVRKTAKVKRFGEKNEYRSCLSCRFEWSVLIYEAKACPGCASKIIEG